MIETTPQYLAVVGGALVAIAIVVGLPTLWVIRQP